ncbi:unnamed protein product [Adineta steineri]|uniref:Nudix hydrolase domain-containing protein n=2 Tax=Adineta steineri TaxID=433720 RepID=A0A815HN07_9BILA|nr:unnamed protein product [Adineta steineri]CAF3976788.1 unnamed protein product [Adineta steineri]
MWKQFFRQKPILIISRCSISSLSNDLIRKRIIPYVDKTNYVNELSQTLPKLESYRRAAILLPIYYNEKTNRVEILVLQRSDKVRSHTGMIVFPGGICDLTDRDVIHTAQREAEEEIGLKSEHYSILGCLPPTIDSRAVVVTPVIALLHSPKFTDYCLAVDEIINAFYVDLEQFLYKKNNHKILDVGDHFVTHHFHIDKYHIWGITAYELITLATIVFQQLPEFPFFRHGVHFDLNRLSEQLKMHFQLYVSYEKKAELELQLNKIGGLK